MEVINHGCYYTRTCPECKAEFTIEPGDVSIEKQKRVDSFTGNLRESWGDRYVFCPECGKRIFIGRDNYYKAPY